MKNLLKVILILVALSLVAIGASAWEDRVTQSGNTTVHVQATGIDSEWITSSHSDEAKSLASFAESFNSTVYRDDLSATEKCRTLTLAAIEAINQKSSVFKGLNDVECSSSDNSMLPELKMTIYPQTNFGYGFIISFTPQSE